MKYKSYSYDWKRHKLLEYLSFLSKYYKCESRFLLRNDYLKSL